jgi:hypothetical protein
VLHQPLERPAKALPGGVTVRVAGPEEAAVWAQINAKGWGHEHPEILDFLGEFGPVAVTEAGSQSQRNAERKGFRIAYTRAKWQLYQS